MESHRVAPQGAAGQAAKIISVIPPLTAALVIIIGLFNFTTVNEAFIAAAMISSAATLIMVFSRRYAGTVTLNDPVAISVFCWCALLCLSTVWAVDRPAAFFSLIGYSTAFSFFLMARSLMHFNVTTGISLARAAGYAGSILSLFSIEMASTGLLRQIYLGPLRSFFRLTEEDADSFGMWVEGSRMQSILGLPNLYATFAAICFFLLLWLILKEKDGKIKPFDLIALAISGTGFFLALSRGGILAFAASVLISVLFAQKGGRLRVLLQTSALALWCAVTAALMTRWMGTGSLIVWIVMALSLYLLVYGWRWIVRALDILAGVKPRTLFLIAAGFALSCVLFLIIALNIRSAFALYSPDTALKRAVSLDAGEHTLTPAIDYWDGGNAVRILIESKSVAQAATQTSDVIFDQHMRGAVPVTFTVPDGSAAVFITIHNTGGGKASIRELDVDGKKIPLQYNLLPESVVSRLQGVWADANILQRFVYWRDGLRLFSKSPVIGLGARAFDSTVHSVADYYYVTRHAHNHYIQMLLECGIVGLAVMVTALVLTFLTLWRNRAKLPPGFAPCMAAAAGMLVTHSVAEASMYNLLNTVLFFLLLGLISGACAGGKKIVPAELSKAFICIFTVLSIALTGGRLLTQAYVNSAETKGTDKALSAYRLAVLSDPLNATDYKSACLTRYATDPGSGAANLAAQYARDLEKNWDTPRDCLVVGLYHLRRNDAEQAARFLERYIELGRVDPAVWNEVLAQYYIRLYPSNNADIASETVPMLAEINASCERLARYLDELNENVLALPVVPDSELMRVLGR